MRLWQENSDTFFIGHKALRLLKAIPDKRFNCGEKRFMVESQREVKDIVKSSTIVTYRCVLIPISEINHC